MKHFNRYSLAMLPLLSILAMSPSVLESQHSGRTIASIEKSEIESKEENKSQELVIADDLKAKSPTVKLCVRKKQIVEEPKTDIGLDKVIMGMKPELEFDEELPKEVVATPKPKLELNEELDEEVVDVPKPELDLDIDPTLEAEGQLAEATESEIEVDDLKLDNLEIKLSEDLTLTNEKEEDEKVKVTETSVTKENEICQKDEKINALTAQVASLITDQSQIMQNLLNMSQMMMMQSMMMQQQMMMSQMNTMGTQTSPYQYANQTTAGNWVYHPQGFQPAQPNIFAPAQNMSRAPGSGFYPDQAHVQLPSWNLQPGTFGNYNLGSSGFNLGGPVL